MWKIQIGRSEMTSLQCELRFRYPGTRFGSYKNETRTIPDRRRTTQATPVSMNETGFATTTFTTCRFEEYYKSVGKGVRQ